MTHAAEPLRSWNAPGKPRRRRLAPYVVAVLAVAGLCLIAARQAGQNDNARGRQDEAKLHATETQLLNTVRTRPDAPTPRLQLADTYLKLGNYGAAEAAARRAAENGADDDVVAPLLARALVHQAKFRLLVNRIAPGQRPAPAEAQVRTALGVARLELYEPDAAERLLRDAERLDDNAVETKIGMVRLLIAQGKIADAEAKLERARALAPDDLDVLRLTALILRGKGDVTRALGALDTMLWRYPDDLQALSLRADILIGQKQLDAAGADLDRLLKLVPYSVTGIYLQALVWAEQGQLARALERLTTISGAFDRFPAGYYLQGTVRYALGLYDLADNSLSNYVAMVQDEVPAHRLLAATAVRRKDTRRAVKLLRALLDAHPADLEAAALLSNIYLMRNDKDQALQVLMHAAAAAPDAPAPAVHPGDADVQTSGVQAVADATQAVELVARIRALASLRNGEISKAASAIEGMARSDPDNDVVQDWLGIVRYRQKNFAAAERIFRQLVERDPGFLDPRRNLGQLYMVTQRDDAAKEIWEGLLERAPGDAESFMNLATIALRRNDAAGAVRQFAQAELASPDDPAPGMALLQVHVAQKNWPLAMQAGRGLTMRFPANVGVIDQAAAAFVDAGKPDDADDFYRALIKLKPGSSAALDRYAAFRRRIGDPDGARRLLAASLALAPDAQHLEALVKFDAETGGPSAGLATARAFAPQQPVAAAWISANILAGANRTTEAIDVLTSAQAETPASPLVIRLAQLEARNGDTAAAARQLQDWLAAHDDDWMVRLELGELHLRQSDYDKARQDYETALTRAPNNAVALNNLAWLYGKAVDPRARALAERAHAASPSAQTADTLGWILLNAGETDVALGFLGEADADAPGDLTIEYHMAVALKSSGDTQKARELLTRILSANGSFEGMEAARRLLEELRPG